MNKSALLTMMLLFPNPSMKGILNVASSSSSNSGLVNFGM